MSGELKRIKIVGAIFPILRENVSNLFGGNKDVFVKFTKLKLESGSTFVFYVTREKLLIGEAKVVYIKKLKPDVAWSRYKDRVFLHKQEYDQYVKISPLSKEKRKMREITVFELENLRRYEKPVKSIYPVTSSGRYLTEEMAKKIRSLNVQ